MPLLINNETVTIEQLINYDGTDKTRLLLQEGIEELRKRFFDKKKNFIIKYRKGMLKLNSLGNMEGKRGVYAQYSDVHSSGTGTNTVTFCHRVLTQPGGAIEYQPKGTWLRKKNVFPESKIEEALYWFKISSVTTIGNTFVVEDLDKDHDDQAEKRKKDSALDYLLYNADSPLANDKDKLLHIAHVWGVKNPENFNDSAIRNKIRDRVLSAKVEEFGTESFIRVVKKGTSFTHALEAINKALSTGGLVYKDFQWVLKSASSSRQNTIMNIAPSDDKRNKVVLANLMLSKPELHARVEAVYRPPEIEELDVESVYTMDQLKEMSWVNIVKLADHHSINTHRIKKQELLKKLVAEMAID